MADYTSFAETPIATRPYGALEAIDSADKTFFANQAKMQSLADMFLAQQMKQAELQRYQGMTPGELDKSAYEGAMARGKTGIIPQTLEGMVGEAQTKAAGGRVATATADTDIALSRSNAKSKISANELTNLSNMVSSYHAQMSSNPMMAPYLYSQMRDAIPENLRAQFPETFTPKVLEGLGKMKQSLSQTIPHLQAMELQNLKEKGDTERTNITAAATRDAAATRASMRVKTLAAQFNEALAKGNDSGIISSGSQLMLDPEIEEGDKARIKAAVDQATRRLGVKLGPKAVPGIGNIPGSDVAAERIIEQLQGPKPGGFDADKERRYQEWKAKQGRP